MRQPYTTIILVLILAGVLTVPSYGAIKGGINYSIPVDYSHLSETELVERGDLYFSKALNSDENKITDDMTNALFIYSVLQNLNPYNTHYSVKLGRLYDKIGMDKYAKGNFMRAISTDKTNGDAYFYLGDFYYKRMQYRKALKYYKEALNKTKADNTDLYFKLGDIYSKIGDTKNALLYLKKAQQLSPSKNLEEKIKQVESINAENQIYYRK